MAPATSAGSAGGHGATRWSAVRTAPDLPVRAARAAVADDVPLLASALAYNAFLAIPATLLLAVGLFSLVAEPDLIGDLMSRFGAVVPEEAVTLVETSLLQLEQRPSTGLAMTLVGLVLAVWTTTGAAGVLMRAINRAHDREDTRTFARRRLVALVIVLALGFALLSVGAALVLGSFVERWLGRVLGAEGVVAWIWWTVRWPLLVLVLLAAFSVVYALATDGVGRRWRLVSPGAVVAVALWLATSSAFGLYASHFGSYNKTWGSLSAAIVTMVWLWLSSLALLYGAEVDAEARRARRELSDSERRSRGARPRRAA